MLQTPPKISSPEGLISHRNAFLKKNAELVLLDSIAAAVESQTIITCEQLRNISNLII